MIQLGLGRRDLTPRLMCSLEGGQMSFLRLKMEQIINRKMKLIGKISITLINRKTAGLFPNKCQLLQIINES
jgi:hypothetical protein